MNEVHDFMCKGKYILSGISQVTFKIPHKMYYPYIERCPYFPHVNIWEILD